MTEPIATASFRRCEDDNDEEIEVKRTIQYTLSLLPSPTTTETEIMALLGRDWREFYCTFHELREPCLYARPVSDLVEIWHPDKIEGNTFCLHFGQRSRRVSDREVVGLQAKWAAKRERWRELEGESEGKVDVDKGEAGEHAADVEMGNTINTASENVNVGRRTKEDGAGSNLSTGGESSKARKGGTSSPGGGHNATRSDRGLSSRTIALSDGDRENSITLLLQCIHEETPLNPRIWQPTIKVLVPRTIKMAGLPRFLRPNLRALLLKDDFLKNDMKKKGYGLTFYLKLDCGDERDAYVDSTKPPPLEIERLRDLLRDDDETVIKISIGFLGQERDEGVPFTIANGLQAFKSPLRYVCLGFIGETVDAEDPTRFPTGVAAIGALDLSDDPASIEILAVAISVLNGMPVGSVAEGEPVAFDSGIALRAELAHAKSEQQLAALVDGLFEGGGTEEELPAAPTYNFGGLGGVGEGLGMVGWLRGGVHVAVQWIDMLPTVEESVAAKMPARTYFDLEGSGPLEEVANLVGKTMKASEGSTWLFTQEVVDTWEIMLFVLPQINESTKMLRWCGGNITQFLRDEGEETDGRLYMEVHVIPTSDGGR
ncbi:hypothetical protein LTR62_006871 [Meristemomyces frigidus]|uniref:Uncharacterized protein n=1 Tax=Meristemomyces frigidus TaxID=1508187 RepID=A0AAN7TD46_9PEZI|nr:hypothetical protein LTR62_006871 [Meristemomyces frigidus]